MGGIQRSAPVIRLIKFNTSKYELPQLQIAFPLKTVLRRTNILKVHDAVTSDKNKGSKDTETCTSIFSTYKNSKGACSGM